MRGSRFGLLPTLLLAGPPMLFFLLSEAPSLDHAHGSPMGHVIVVTAIAACAFVVALTSADVGVRSAHSGPVWLSLGCICVALLMTAHALLTPGVLGQPANVWIGRAPYLAITCFAVALALASRPRNTWTSGLALRRPAAVLGVPTLLLLGLVITVVEHPTALWGHRTLAIEEGLRTAVLVVDAVLLSRLTVIHWRRWRLGHDAVQWALMSAAGMCLAALTPMHFGTLWRISWWLYHVFLLLGFGAAVFVVWSRYWRTHAVDEVLLATFETDPMTHIVSGYPQALRTLVRAVEAKDAYTHGHSERTARVAVQLGLWLSVDEDTLRVLARGAYLHDVGKMAIPDAVLNKPGALSPAERAVIETHPGAGRDLIAPVAELREVIPAVLHHHERWDATGYPEQLGGTDIPLVARIVAIADVWDALTSDRAYRRGLEPMAALAHIAQGRGSHFDPELVDAFLALAADWGYDLIPAGPDAIDGREADHLVESCHAAGANRT